MQSIKKPELLAPAGNLIKLKTALQYGADAVYMGGESFSLRNASDNFSEDEIKYGIDYAKAHGKNAYIAANIIMRDRDFDSLYHFFRDVYDAGADAVIIADPGAISIVKDAAPNLKIHISTQANTTNSKTADMWHSLGASRVILARELSEAEIRNICANTHDDLEIEIFVHGAMCISYSGRCLLSNYMAGRDANRGECAQSCRWKYSLVEEKRPGEYMPVYENDSGSFFFNSKDLCLIEFIPELANLGVSSLKIEGRVKSEYYVATVVKAYREELDRYFENPEKYTLDKRNLEELCKVSHREYFHGFFKGPPLNEGQIYNTSSYIRDYDVVGIVTECDREGNAVIEQRNKFSKGDEIEILCPKGDFIKMTVEAMYDDNGDEIQSAPHPVMTVKMKLPEYVPQNSMLRKRKSV
ncbi:MAG: putative protease YhbU precursor [Firmicutes bacterium ADurb.Bin193]|nr:MAG: putative protease YhbU precursor [Firmicutes bacterium ADurb.Bin193]